MRAILLFCLMVSAQAVYAAGIAKHFVVVVWDGMRPDFVAATDTPTLHALAERGVFFQNHHCVFLSSTEVNGTALATGAHPQRSGIIANREYWPAVNSNRPIATESLEAIRKSDRLGHHINVPTLAEILQRNGHQTMIAGSKPVAVLQDRADRPDTAESAIVFEGRSLPASRLADITAKLGAFPASTAIKTNRDNWTARALTGALWAKGVPAFSLLWLAEPDSTQHNTSPGSAASLASIRNCDRALALVIDTLKDKGVLDSTDIFVVSDHAFSTVNRSVNVAARLQKAGFNASREFTKPPARGDVLVIGLGGSALIYVAGHDAPTIKRLATFLQGEDYVGVVFTRKALKGTFALKDGLIQSSRAPDVAVSLRWTADRNSTGTPGQVVSETSGGDAAGAGNRGTHVSLSRYDLNNTLIAAGPDFQRGMTSRTPTGNIDLAPTILHLAGVGVPRSMDGRVLVEALNTADAKAPRVRQWRLEAQASLPGGEWRQYLVISEVNGVRYLDEGNGTFIPRHKPE